MNVSDDIYMLGLNPQEEVFNLNTFNGLKLRTALLHGKHDEFKAFLESNPVDANWVINSLRYILKLVTNKDRTISEITPTLRILLQYGVKRSLSQQFYSNWTPYHVICVASGDHHELLGLVNEELGASLINAKNCYCITPLIYAVKKANLKCVRKLIVDGADVNCRALISGSINPLIDSIHNLHFNEFDSSYKTMMDVFDLLLDSGVDVNKPCHLLLRTPVMYAAAWGMTKCVQKLIQKGAELYATDSAVHNAWTLAAWKGGVEVLKCLLEDGGIDKNSIDKRGYSVLHWAVTGRNIPTVRYLLNLGITITTDIPQSVDSCKSCGKTLSCYYRTGRNPSTKAYMEAIQLNMLELVKLMDEHGCHLYQSTDSLNYAIHCNSVEVVDYLLCKHKYRINDEYIECYDRNEWAFHQTFLMKACHEKSVQVATLLLKHGADPNIMGCIRRWHSTINMAIHKRHVEIIALFLRVGLNVNLKSNHPLIGCVLPFEAAVYEEHIYAVEMLLLSGCACGVHSLDNNHVLKDGVTHELQERLKKWNVHKNNVIPLQQRCRMVILNHLCPQADKKILELPIPTTLIKYLSIPELDDVIKAFKNNPHSIHTYVNS